MTERTLVPAPTPVSAPLPEPAQPPLLMAPGHRGGLLASLWMCSHGGCSPAAQPPAPPGTDTCFCSRHASCSCRAHPWSPDSPPARLSDSTWGRGQATLLRELAPPLGPHNTSLVSWGARDRSATQATNQVYVPASPKETLDAGWGFWGGSLHASCHIAATGVAD